MDDVTRRAAEPSLYDAIHPEPVLRGTRCRGCDRVFFPPLGLGCEVCGSESLEEVDVAAAGTIHSVATVHRHARSEEEGPFTVAEVVLDAGPLIRCVMKDDPSPSVIGLRVRAQWVEVGRDEDGAASVEPRFVLEDRS